MKKSSFNSGVLKVSFCVLALTGFIIQDINSQTPKLTLDLSKPGAT